jgi:DNA-directed RNA polymerase II subunit RPB1
LGVPRFKELINAPKKVKTPSLTVYLKEGLNKSKDTVEEIMKQMICVRFADIYTLSEVFYDPMLDGTTCVREDQDLVDSFGETPDDYLSDDLQKSPWVLRFEINANILLKHRLRLVDVEEKIRDLFGNSIITEYNDEFCNPCVIRIRPITGKDGSDNDDVVLVQMIPYLEDIKLCGIDGITKTFAVKDPKTKEYRIETDGSNLSEIMSMSEIDFKKTFCNDPHETLNVLGVEAARATFLKEMNIALSFDNNYVNIHQPMQLADVMTFNGGLMTITRHGINRRANYGPFSKCSFEETVEVLTDAARFGQVDELKGVTERIIMGMYADIGTHAFDVFIDTNMLNTYAQKVDQSILTARVGEDAKNGFDFNSGGDTNPMLFVPSSPSRTVVDFNYGSQSDVGFIPSSPGREQNTFVPSSPSRE